MNAPLLSFTSPSVKSDDAMCRASDTCFAVGVDGGGFFVLLLGELPCCGLGESMLLASSAAARRDGLLML